MVVFCGTSVAILNAPVGGSKGLVGPNNTHALAQKFVLFKMKTNLQKQNYGKLQTSLSAWEGVPTEQLPPKTPHVLSVYIGST